ncbi:hypothetical protein DFH08DRAFT_1089211 [Mycena albidolilacea]|uniref:Uncharacterized protein n=1 Tax=Mycena albidolilacea TaxID=1033008 RepID=A0AAD6Z275_9AGAR|nr:hypothetical protein DFH08DRAFT_1089211 [Mycena albidolilacea]
MSHRPGSIFAFRHRKESASSATTPTSVHPAAGNPPHPGYRRTHLATAWCAAPAPHLGAAVAAPPRLGAPRSAYIIHGAASLPAPVTPRPRLGAPRVLHPAAVHHVSPSRASSRRSAESFRTLRMRVPSSTPRNVGFTAAWTSPARDEGAEEDTGREEERPDKRKEEDSMASSTTAPAQDARLDAHPHRPPTLIPRSLSLSLLCRLGVDVVVSSSCPRPAPDPHPCAALSCKYMSPTPPRTASALPHRALPLPQRRARHTPRAPERPPTVPTPASDPHLTRMKMQMRFTPAAPASENLQPQARTDQSRRSSLVLVLVSVSTATSAMSCGAVAEEVGDTYTAAATAGADRVSGAGRADAVAAAAAVVVADPTHPEAAEVRHTRRRGIAGRGRDISGCSAAAAPRGGAGAVCKAGAVVAAAAEGRASSSLHGAVRLRMRLTSSRWLCEIERRHTERSGRVR